ncbi:MAG TPA: DUF255 domain-containing protein [Candidatus Eisenbacteria bacterium]|nr:DUF255 domain-containing protein [Candidatus Eisenbacteria bacterium]
MLRRVLLSILLLLALAPRWASAAAAPTIEWRAWSRAAFDEARDKRRLVLLDITASWCHWCRVMAEESYADSAVVAEIKANFVPIRVDYDERPDIGDRYLTNGWPTTGVLSANGHLLLAKTYLPAPALREFLSEAVHFYRVNRQQVDRKVAEAEKAVARTWQPDSLLPPSLSEEEYIEQNLRALRDLEDKEHGGFGSAPKTPRWDAISFLLRAADARRDDALRALAVRATVAALALQDSLDGGIFRFALEPGWTKLRYERLLDQQASALSILTRVYRATAETRFRDAAARVAAFVDSMLVAGGTWHASVGPDVHLRDGRWMEGDLYYRLSLRARRGQGAPPRSPLVTLDAGARAASASMAWGGRTGAAADPRGELDRLARLLSRGDGSYFHAISGKERTAPGLLADQVAVGHAFLDAYRVSADPSWLARADSAATWMRLHLEDSTGEGFRYAPRDTAAIGRLRAGDKPEIANAEAGAFFLRLYWLTDRQDFKDAAERTAHYLQSGEKIVLDPARAELVLRLRQEPVRLLVVGPRTGTGRSVTLADELRRAARNAPPPEVVVRYLDELPAAGGAPAWPDGLPANAQTPAIYRWTKTGWRGPVIDPAKLGEILDKPVAEP